MAQTLSDCSDLPGQAPHSLSELAGALEQSQSNIEEEKAALVRMLHDDLGGLLVGAIMDIGWISQQPGHADPVKEKLARATGLLRAAIDMKRELIENLRPTLLDNVGLFSTLRWHLKASCDAAGVPYTDNFPSSELTLTPDIKIGVFRIFQEALKHILSERTVGELSFEVEISDSKLHCRLKSEHLEREGAGDNERVSPETSMHHRAERIGGTLQWLRTPDRNHIDLQIPFRPLPS